MIVFREDKTYEEELKTWQFWHSRQHSAKQRILEVVSSFFWLINFYLQVDSKNSSGMIGQIEEIAHNAVQFYWNPSDQNSVKVSQLEFPLSLFPFPEKRRLDPRRVKVCTWNVARAS